MSEDAKKVEKVENDKLPVMKTSREDNVVINVAGKKGRNYKFLIPFGVPLKEAYEAAINAANEIGRLFAEVIEKQKDAAKKKEAQKKEETKKAE